MVGDSFYAWLPPVILASQSSRRAQLLHEMGIRFSVRPADIDESTHVHDCAITDLPLRLAAEKASKVYHSLSAPETNSLVIAADTIVLLNGLELDKPVTREEALARLALLSGHEHTVKSGVYLLSNTYRAEIESVTKVKFAQLSQEQMEYYVATCNPFDKAGGYGIQDWIGHIGVESIHGSYTNVMGLPTHALHRELLRYREVTPLS